MTQKTIVNIITVLALLVAGLSYGYWDYKRKNSRPPGATPAPTPSRVSMVEITPPPPLLTSLVTWSDTVDAETQKTGLRVLQLADAACRLDALRRHISSIRIDVKTGKTYLWVQDEYGWPRVVTLDIEMRDDQATWNALGPDPRRVAGQTFHLMAGGGKRPALVAGKEWIRNRCGMDIGYAGENGILDMPDLAFLDTAERKKQRRKPAGDR